MYCEESSFHLSASSNPAPQWRAYKKEVKAFDEAAYMFGGGLGVLGSGLSSAQLH